MSSEDWRAPVLAVAREAAREAGEILMAHLGRIRREDVGTKSAARDLVTAAAVADEGPRWFLDPLDGTVNFVHRLPMFAVSMGLFVDGEPEVAVVHAPRLGETFTATRGGGAHLDGDPLRVSPARELGESILATGFPYRRSELEHDNLANFAEFFYDVRDLRRGGSAACDLAYTAAGRIDAFWELHLSPHDVAAGALLVREAGGVVTDADGGEDWLRGGHVIAGPPALHALLLGRVKH